MKIAILCSGLEHRKDRGYENSSRNLFENLSRDYSEVFLFKGSGLKEHKELVLEPFIPLKFLQKLSNKLFNDSFVLEYVQFAILYLLLVIIKRLKFDVIYTQEPRTAKTLFQLQRFLPISTKIVFGMGVNMTPEHYININQRVHLVNIEHFKEAKRIFPESKKFYLIPNPANEKKTYNWSLTKAELRKHYNIMTDKVLLSVGAINSGIKRMDYIVREAALLDENWTLVICGNVHDQSIIELGRELLRERFIHFKLAPDQVAEAYALADVFVLASLIEGFGNVTIEAMQNGLPVLLHKRELNRWIVEDEDLLVDMTRENALANRIVELEAAKRLYTKGHLMRERFDIFFSWDANKDKYLKLLNFDESNVCE